MIDAGKDPEGYAKYLKEREEKRKRERQQQRKAEETSAPLKKVKTLESKAFKVGSKVVVLGLQKNPEKNGAIGTLRSYLSDKERWTVEFQDRSTNNFKIDNLRLVDEQTSATTAEDDDTSDIPTSKVYVTNLSAETTGNNLTDLFSSIGVIAREPVRDAKGKSKGFPDEWPFAVKLYKPGLEGGDACVKFEDKSSAKAAIKRFNGTLLRGSMINVEYAGGGPVPANAGNRARERSRSRERLAELEKLKKKLDEDRRPAELDGIFLKG